MMDKSSFVMYAKYLRNIKKLTLEQRGLLFTAILSYASDQEIPELDAATDMAFSFIQEQMDRDYEVYLEKCRKRSEAGKLGGRPKTIASDEKQVKAKKANGFSEKQNNPDIDNEPDSDNDTDKKINTLADAKAMFERLWKLYPNKKGKGQVSDTQRSGYSQSGKIGLLKRLIATVWNCRRTPTGGKHSTGAHFLTVAMWIIWTKTMYRGRSRSLRVKINSMISSSVNVIMRIWKEHCSIHRSGRLKHRP